MQRKYHRIPQRAIKVDLPNTIQQKDFSCGAAALQSVCAYYGVGPMEEWEFTKDLRMDRRVGSHPYQIKRAAKHYGLRVSEHQPMSIELLKKYLDEAKPVLMMIQAWNDLSDDGPINYRDIWSDGHWVVAIGYDESGIFFEDPSLEALRGFLTYEELDERWHDTGPHGVHLQKYGMAISKPRFKNSRYDNQALVLK